MNTLTTPQKSWPLRQPIAFLILAAIVWLGLYQTLLPGSEALADSAPGANAVDKDQGPSSTSPSK
ncbi:hypothetical protein [Rhodoferax sp.]|uniref:hypothetical protein n=1 Tax=Rhodoferax sp. TaxID=50421 RepID=UPI002715EFA7|nr:hypothetical protein [Rhodoferax sp.]MDO9197397.1 hypothetical protein [Rhodoferax sp.]